MADRPIDLYLNDHMAGAMLGAELAGQIANRSEGTPLGGLITPVAIEIDEDREALDGLMERLDVGRNIVKQAGGWLTEKWSRIKFSGLGSGEPDQGNFMALETLALGILGKRSLWVALRAVEGQHEAIQDLDLEKLIARAERQHAVVERARIQAAVGVLSGR